MNRQYFVENQTMFNNDPDGPAPAADLPWGRVFTDEEKAAWENGGGFGDGPLGRSRVWSPKP